MQNFEKTLLEDLEEIFNKKPRLEKDFIKVNLPKLNRPELFRLIRIVTNSNLGLEIKRSGTGLVIIINI